MDGTSTRLDYLIKGIISYRQEVYRYYYYIFYSIISLILINKLSFLLH
jgi:hypothetical protein